MKGLLTKVVSMFAYFAPAGDMNDFSEKLRELMNDLWGPLLAITSGAAALIGIWIGWRFWASAGDEAKRKDVKTHVKYFVIGLIAIFVIAALVPLVIAALQTWMAS